MRGRRGFAAIAGGFAIGAAGTAATLAMPLAGPASAATVLNVAKFAGYQTYKTGAVTATTTFAVPSVTCGADPSGVAPGLEAQVAANPNATAYLYAATLQMQCANGSLSIAESMFASGLETRYAKPVAVGDTIKTTITTTAAGAGTTGGTTITMQDTTPAHAFTLTDSGSESYEQLQYFGVSATNDMDGFVPTPPSFTPVQFTNTTVGTKSLNAISPRTALQYGSTGDCLVYAIPTQIVNAKTFAVEIPPVNITGYTPNTEPVGQVVTIDGWGFTSKTKVTFAGGKPAPTMTLVSPTELEATIPPAALPGPLTVTNTSAPIGTMSDLCSFEPQPVVSSFSATSGPTGKTINIDGGGFSNVTSLTIGTTPITAYAVSTPASPTVIKATIPNGAVTGKITVNTEWGDATSAGPYTVTLSITGFTPTSGSAGSTVTITGVGFNKSSKVSFAKTKATTTFISSSELRAVVPANFAGGEISVTNSQAPTGTVSSPGTFQ